MKLLSKFIRVDEVMEKLDESIDNQIDQLADLVKYRLYLSELNKEHDENYHHKLVDRFLSKIYFSDED